MGRNGTKEKPFVLSLFPTLL